MTVVLTLLNFLATGPGMLFIGLLAILMILAWEWRVSLMGLILIQLGITPIAVFIQDIDLQWVTVQTLVIILCSLILALSVTQIAGSPTSRQSGNWPLRLMVVIMLYVSWRLFQFDIAIPLIDPRVSVLFNWLFICALVILALSDNPLFTGSALILWFIPMHVVVATLFPFSNLIVLFGFLELSLALCCSYLILAERLGESEQIAIATDVTFPSTAGPRLLVDRAGNERPELLPNDRTTMDLLAVPIAKELTLGQPKSSRPNSESAQSNAVQPTQQPLPAPTSSSPSDTTQGLKAVHPKDRTGEHPLVSAIAKGKRAKKPKQ